MISPVSLSSSNHISDIDVPMRAVMNEAPRACRCQILLCVCMCSRTLHSVLLHFTQQNLKDLKEEKDRTPNTCVLDPVKCCLSRTLPGFSCVFFERSLCVAWTAALLSRPCSSFGERERGGTYHTRIDHVPPAAPPSAPLLYIDLGAFVLYAGTKVTAAFP
jgi:hypothetical protein